MPEIFFDVSYSNFSFYSTFCKKGSEVIRHLGSFLFALNHELFLFYFAGYEYNERSGSGKKYSQCFKNKCCCMPDDRWTVYPSSLLLCVLIVFPSDSRSILIVYSHIILELF